MSRQNDNAPQKHGLLLSCIDKREAKEMGDLLIVSKKELRRKSIFDMVKYGELMKK